MNIIETGFLCTLFILMLMVIAAAVFVDINYVKVQCRELYNSTEKRQICEKLHITQIKKLRRDRILKELNK